MLWLTLKFSFIYSFHPYYTVFMTIFPYSNENLFFETLLLTFTAISSLDLRFTSITKGAFDKCAGLP